MTHDITLKYPKNPVSVDIVFAASIEIVAIALIIVIGILIKKPIHDFINWMISKGNNNAI